MLTIRRGGRIRLFAPLLTFAFVAAACAGDVGKYRDVAAGRQQDTTPGIDSALSPSDTASIVGDVESSVPYETGGRAEDALEPGQAAPTGAGAVPAEPGAAEATPSSPNGASESGPPDGRDVGVTPTQIVVGLFSPKSGHYAAVTRNMPVAVQGAFDEVNANGGVHGRTLVLKTYDDAGSDANTIIANHRRARDEAFAYLSITSTSTEILAPVADRDRVPHIFGNAPEAMARNLRYGFTAWPYLATQAKILPSFIINHLQARNKKIGVVFEDSQTMTQAKDVFKAHATREGLKVVAEQSVRATQSTCTNEVANLQSRGAELVVQINGPFAAICMYRDARTLGYRPLWTAPGSTQQFNVVATGSGGAADGAKTLTAFPTLETPAGRRYSSVMRKYQPDSNAEDDDFAFPIYGTAQLLIQALRQAGPALTSERLVDAMETKMSGFNSGYAPPPVFGRGDRRGPQSVAVVACCTSNRWTTIDTTWRERF